jgi:hypothetical protein
MKRIILGVLLSFLLSGILFAEQGSLTFEVYGGLGYGSEIEETENFAAGYEIDQTQSVVTSGTGGLKAHYYLLDSLSFSAGLAYALRRTKVVIVDQYGQTDSYMTVKRTALQVPLMLRWGTGFYIAGGGYLAFQLGDATAEEADMDFPESVQNKTDYGFLGEIGYRFFETVSLGLNVEWGLPYVIEFPETESLGYKIKNRQISLFIGIELDLLN